MSKLSLATTTPHDLVAPLAERLGFDDLVATRYAEEGGSYTGALEGEFVWHHHDEEDELFLVIKGSLVIKLRDRDIRLEEGEFVVIPRGVEHLPIAEEEAHVLLLEPKSTLNTGNVTSERTVAELQHI